MPDPASSNDLLRSLGRLARGLSALFWGLPLALIVCAQMAWTNLLSSFGVVAPVVTTGLVLFGLLQMGQFQRQERVWRSALDRAQLLALINLGLSPFVYWWSRAPEQPFFGAMLSLFAVTGLIFLSQLNVVLLRLSAMLPDETLRLETRQFTPINRILLALTLLLVVANAALTRVVFSVPEALGFAVGWIERAGRWFPVLLTLLPLAMTMALIWKTKEVILDSVFSAKS
jgi:hypothetical protein